MGFITDKQTIDDLGIFGVPGADSIFSIYNLTSTVGGSAILEEMFTYPLSDAALINERINIFRFFAEKNISFPFQTELFGIVEHYLENIDQRTRLTHDQSTLGKKIIGLINPDAEYKMLHKGVISLRELLIELWNFLHRDSINDHQSFSRERELMLGLLKTEQFLEVAQENKNDKPGSSAIVDLDTSFRFKNRQAIKKILEFIYRLDAYIAVGKAAMERKLCFPVALEILEGSLSVKNVYHLLLKAPVPNSIEVNRDKNLVFLTGANMAGKSTFMKTLGIAVFLAHAGFPVPAEEMEFPVMDGIFTTINLSDNLSAGSSHFYAEVLRVKKVAAELKASKNLFVTFDELFRGTNVKDAYEATVAITRAFAQKRNSIFVISTHIIEAGQVLKEKCCNIQFQYLPTRMNGNEPVCTYLLEQGITNDRHGMLIIQNEGILDILNGNPTTIE